MRDLDQKQKITGDFICVYGDVVANISMEAVLSAHRARREKSKKAIMTMVLREAGDVHRTKSHHMRPVFVIDPEAERCVHYEQLRRKQTPRLDIADEILKEHVEVEVREDLIDCGIDVCTPEVLAQYTDNFDWQMPRRGFLYGILKDYETNQLTIHTHITSHGYAARVKNLQAYDAVSRDVVSRWTYPLCPDVNMITDQSYRLERGNIYKEDGVVLARSSVVGRKSVLGRATSIGDGSTISNSVIGRRCVIGKRVRIHGAYIWDDARIGDDTVVDKAIIAKEASVGRGCHVQAGALVSFGVSIADETTVKGNSRITKHKRERKHSRTFSASKIDSKPTREGGEIYQLEIDEDEDELAETLLSGDIYNMAELSMSADSISTLDSDNEDEEDNISRRRTSRSDSFASTGSDEGRDARRKAADFHHEAVAGIVDALDQRQSPGDVQLELNGLRFSSNAEDIQIRRAVAIALMKRIAILIESGMSPKDAVADVLPSYKLLVESCVTTGKGEFSEQVDFLLHMQKDLVHRQQGDKILLFVSNVLATNDLVEAEGFEQWWNDPRSAASEELRAVRQETKPLVDVLAGESEDDDDEDEDDSE
jgi:translation initiation factor eIF-2B subunit epsilon